MRIALATLAGCALAWAPGCGGGDEPSPPPAPVQPFTPEAAREAYKRLLTETNPATICEWSTPNAQRLFERSARSDYGLQSASCEEAVARRISEGPDDSPGRIDAEERRDLAIEPEMDRRTQVAGFVDEFGNGVVFRRVDGRWLFAGLISR